MAWVTKSSQETYVNNETPREYTKTEKAGNWWHYHKWQVVAVIVALVLVASFIKETVFSTKPDYQVAFVGIQDLPDDTVSALTEALQSFGEDLNGDGQVAVLVNQYVLDMDKLSDTTEVDPYMQMAGLTRLSADVSSRDGSFIYLLEDPALFESYTGALSYLDGTIPAENYWEDYAEIAANWNTTAVAFDGEDMVVTFSPYELAAFGFGPQAFRISYGYLEPYLSDHGRELLGLSEG